jgi:hypothetical protein
MDLVSAKDKECAPDKMCSCNVCNLIAHNTNIDDVVVEVQRRTPNKPPSYRIGSFTIPNYDIPDAVKFSIYELVYDQFRYDDLKVGKSRVEESERFAMIIYRHDNITFDFSFRTKNIEPVPDDADPLPMD